MPRLSFPIDRKSMARLEQWAPNEEDRAKMIREGIALAALYHKVVKGGGRVLIEESRGEALSQIVLP
jgi:hypothetical protein